MKRSSKTLILLICCGIIMVAAAGIALADPVILSGGSAKGEESDNGPGNGTDDDGSTWATATVITGPILQINDEYLLIDSVNDTESGPVGMVSLRIDPDLTLIVDAADGYPLSFSDLKEDETVCAYVGPAMTLSLPPQLSASMVIGNIPDDGSVPLFVKAASLEESGDGNYKLTVAGGASYMLPAGCQIRPYLTRNIVTFSDITPGANLLIWPDADDTVMKVVIVQQ